jgi:hypothetical protein
MTHLSRGRCSLMAILQDKKMVSYKSPLISSQPIIIYLPRGTPGPAPSHHPFYFYILYYAASIMLHLFSLSQINLRSYILTASCISFGYIYIYIVLLIKIRDYRIMGDSSSASYIHMVTEIYIKLFSSIVVSDFSHIFNRCSMLIDEILLLLLVIIGTTCMYRCST